MAEDCMRFVVFTGRYFGGALGRVCEAECSNYVVGNALL